MHYKVAKISKISMFLDIHISSCILFPIISNFTGNITWYELLISQQGIQQELFCRVKYPPSDGTAKVE